MIIVSIWNIHVLIALSFILNFIIFKFCKNKPFVYKSNLEGEEYTQVIRKNIRFIENIERMKLFKFYAVILESNFILIISSLTCSLLFSKELVNQR